MSSYAGQSLRSAAFICTPCRLLLARRTAAAAPPGALPPRLLNPSRPRTYSDKPKPAVAAPDTPKTPPPVAPKKKKKKKKASKPQPPKTDDARPTTTDVTMIQEALNKIKSAIYGAGNPDAKTAPTADTKAQTPGSEQPTKKKSGKGRRKVVRKATKKAKETETKPLTPEQVEEHTKKPEAETRGILAQRLGGKSRDVSRLSPEEQKKARTELRKELAKEMEGETQQGTKLGAFLAARFGEKTWGEAQISHEDRGKLQGIRQAAAQSSQQAGAEGEATTKPAATKAHKKKKTSPLLAHLDETPQGGQEEKRGKKDKIVPDIVSIHAKELELTPVEREQPPVPALSYGLDRVLFNPGVYHLQDPRSRVYNFDPYLAGIMPVKEFDFDALKQYITSSKDTTLINVAAEQGKKYAGSTSSMTSMLAHFHYLLSSWRPINTDNLSRSFPVESTSFTMIQRCPAAIFLHWKDGTYAIDADKEFDSANVLSMLGKSMEKLLTLPKEDFEKYRRVNSSQLTEEERNADESYHYTTMGDFMMRSQLDAHDARIPGTGMFDLKTRAVVSIRMDAKDYLKGVGYEIKKRFGQWESYEREYYDMIRSAFLKYSLQVRMGRMDGIFVAFHNTQRIFGFQYISLSEMDQSLHGTGDTTLGTQEFKFSLHLLNKLLDRATKKWPEQSLRLHFETRPSETPFMYVFATPVTTEQIEEVQNKNKAEVERFEREMMGIVREAEADVETARAIAEEEAKEEEEEEEEDDEEETSLDVWEDMRTKVEETLENDELGADFVRDVMEDALEESGLLRTGSHDEKESYLDAIMEVITIGSEARRGEDGGSKTTGEVTMTSEGDIEDATAEKPVDEVATREPESLGEAEHESAAENDEGYESEAKDEAVSSEEAANAEGPSLKDLIIRLATKSRASPTGQSGMPQEHEDDLSSDEQRLREFEHILYQMVEKRHEMKTSATEEPSSEDETTTPTEPAPTTDESEPTILAEDAAEETVDHLAEDSEVLGMILTLRNKVNGQYVTRPMDLNRHSNWTVEYAIEELPAVRAKTLYESCIARRQKALAPEKVVSRGKFDEQFRKKLEELSNAGRAWRLREIEKAKNRPVHVYGVDGALKYEEVFSEDGEPMPESRVGK